MDEREAFEEIDRLRQMVGEVFLWMKAKGVLSEFEEDHKASYAKSCEFMDLNNGQ